jgi:hypothetical protein
MELNDLIFLAAASLRAPTVPGNSTPIRTYDQSIREAKELWRRVLELERDGE